MPDPIDLDLSGLKCPMPIVRLSQAVKGAEPGQEITVTADDPAFRPDVEAWCRSTGNELVSLEEREGSIVGVVRRAS